MNIPIFLASDNTYAPHVAVTIASICANTNSFIEFYILDGGITEENKVKIQALKSNFANFSIEFLFVDVLKEFEKMPTYDTSEYITLSTYNRLLITKLKPQLGKVIYLDVDIVLKGDIKELFDIDLENYALGAAWDINRTNYELTTKELVELSEDYKYFNAGVLLIDCKKWIEQDILNKIYDIVEKYGDRIKNSDETLLNKCFDCNYKIFDIKYDYMDYDYIHSPDIKPFIRHFATRKKPWNYSTAVKLGLYLPLYEEYWYYLEMTKFYDEVYAKANTKESLEEQDRLLRDFRIRNLIKNRKKV